MIIPEFLGSKKIWLVWKYEMKGGKKTKVPYQMNGSHARTNDKDTWNTLEEVKKYREKGFDGIGFCFDGFTGVDLDHCLIDGVPNEQAADIVEQLDSYTEISPSGEGLHIIVDGQIKHDRCKSKDKTVELYSKGRFFTFTGNSFGEPSPVKRNVTGLVSVYMDYVHVQENEEKIHTTTHGSQDADEVMDRMKRSKVWPQIDALMNGIMPTEDHSAADLSLCNRLAFFSCKDPKVMDEIFRSSKLYRPKWDEMHGARTYGQITIDRACTGTSEVWNPESAARPTEGGNAQRFLKIHRNGLRYCGHQSVWYVWDGTRWEVDTRLIVHEKARDVVKELYREVQVLIDRATRGEEVSPDMVKAGMKLAMTADTWKGMSNMLNIAKGLPGFGISPADLDNKPETLNVIDGTIVFEQNGYSIKNPDRNDLLTKRCECRYDPHARCPNWIKFVGEIFEGDPELARYVQKAIGYSLTGKMTEKCFFFCWGDGSNGKSVFLNVIRYMLRDYGQQASIKTFLKRRNDSEIRDDLVNLKGARFVSAVEPDDNAKFDMEVMKPLTGNDIIRCRTLYQRQIEYLPQCSLWIAGNNKPVITETNAGAWDRVRLIPFLVSFIGREDRGLEDRLKTELSGILNWALEGYKMYKKEGLIVPACVKDATEEYRMECNSLMGFINQKCTMGGVTRKSVFYKEYKDWCENEGQYPYSARRVKGILKGMNIECHHTVQGDIYHGIKIITGLPEITVQKEL